MSSDHKLLLVDDEEELLSILESHLEMMGFNLLTASSGQAALEILRQQEIDLVICDFIMPEMGGKELFQAASELPSRPPFIFCSGLNESPYGAEMPKGIVGFMQKPFHVDDLINMINKELKIQSQSGPL